MRIVITFSSIGKDYSKYIKMAFASAKLFGYETVLVTGDEIEAGQDHTIKIEKATEETLMPWILKAQKAFIDSPLFDQNSVLFSPDTLVAKHLEPVFYRDFELGVTTGTHPEYPVNNGVIYIRPEAKTRLSKLWGDMIVRCIGYGRKYQTWYGDQKAVHEEIREHEDRPYGLNVKRLQFMPYNAAFTNDGKWTGTDELIWQSAYVLHFKGERKERMEEFWIKIKDRLSRQNSEPLKMTFGPLRTMNAEMPL